MWQKENWVERYSGLNGFQWIYLTFAKFTNSSDFYVLLMGTFTDRKTHRWMLWLKVRRVQWGDENGALVMGFVPLGDNRACACSHALTRPPPPPLPLLYPDLHEHKEVIWVHSEMTVAYKPRDEASKWKLPCHSWSWPSGLRNGKK